MALLSAAVASSATSQSINSGSLVFNPILVLDSPEASIRANPSTDTSTQFRDTSATSTARARATLSTTGDGGEEEDGGMIPGASLGSSRQGNFLAGDLVPRQSGGLLSGTGGLLLIGGLAVAAYFVARRFF